MASCPICGRPALPRRDNATYPFCSPRCKQIDLGKWLNEEYRVPVEREEPSEATEGSDDSQEEA